MTTKTGTYDDFKAHTLALVRGERGLESSAPKIWLEQVDGAACEVRFQSVEAGAKLLSPKNRAMLRLIAEKHPQSVHELAMLTGRAEQNLMRTLRKLSSAGIIHLNKGNGRAYRPTIAATKVHFEIDLLAG